MEEGREEGREGAGGSIKFANRYTHTHPVSCDALCHLQDSAKRKDIKTRGPSTFSLCDCELK